MTDDQASRGDVHDLTKTLLAPDDEARPATAVDDDPRRLPGVDAEEMTLREGLAKGGRRTFILLLILNSLDELETGALALLAPEIRDSFAISDGTITFIASATVVFTVLGTFPMGWMADRFNRGRIIGAATLVYTMFVVLTGLVTNAFTLFCARFGVGMAKANSGTVHMSLLADTYPVGIRGRIGASIAFSSRLILAVSPALIGIIVTVAGGDDGWRWAFLILGLPVSVFAVLAFFLPEPPRGQWEKSDVVGAVVDESDALPISIEAAFARLSKIATFKHIILGFAAMGFAAVTLPIQIGLFVEREYQLDTLARGFWASATWVPVLLVLPFAGKLFDRVARSSPDRSLRLVAFALIPQGILTPVQFFMPNEVLFFVVGLPNIVLSTIASSMVLPIVQLIVPYRLRGLGGALATLYIFLLGALGGSLAAALLVDAYDIRTAVIILVLPSMLIGGIMILRGASSVVDDLELIAAELEEEYAEDQRRKESPDTVPAIQMSGVDFSYGRVQVLFDMSFSVQPGETLALLGTNGAGKSTALNVIIGLLTPEKGHVRFHGRTMTFTSPEHRAALGIQMLPGGRGTFPDLTIEDNLLVGAWRDRSDRAVVDRRVTKVLNLFPVLGEKRHDLAKTLSGGQQQQLALARVMLYEPEVLIIDELSLGLAPAIVADLLETIERLKAAGQTMIIVEQSLNVALAIADRAIFLEKGEVRFEGSAQDLAERDDLARAVFLGEDGG